LAKSSCEKTPIHKPHKIEEKKGKKKKKTETKFSVETSLSLSLRSKII